LNASHCTLFFYEFLSEGFSHVKFLMRQCLIQAYALSHVFPTGVFLEIKLRHRLPLKPCRFHDRVTTKQIILIFFPQDFSKEFKNILISRFDSVKGGVLQKHYKSIIDLLNEAYQEAAHKGFMTLNPSNGSY
jgi:hypothetical protein